MAEFPDLLINPNPNAPTLDASGNQVRGINIFETTAERDALNITVRIPGALAVIKGSDELYQYTANTVDDAAWQNASNWLGIGSAGGAGVQNLNNLNGNLTLVGAGSVTITDDGNSTITIDSTGGGGGVTDVDGETGSINLTAGDGIDIDVVTGTGEIEISAPASSFVGLTDTPAAYTNAYDRPVSVTDVESGLQFSDYVYTSIAGDTVAFRTRRDESFSTAGVAEGLMVKPDYVLGAPAITSQLAHFWNGSGWSQMDNTSASTCTGMAAMGITASGQPLARALSQGFIKLASNPTGATAGGVLYFGASGTLTGTAPTGSGEVVRVAGHAMDTNGFIYFNPSNDWIVLA